MQIVVQTLNIGAFAHKPSTSADGGWPLDNSMFDFFEIFYLSDEWVSSWLRCQFLIFLLTATVDKQYTNSVKCWVTFTIRLTYIHFIFSLLKVDAEHVSVAVTDRPQSNYFLSDPTF